jgi:hypothetical protein
MPPVLANYQPVTAERLKNPEEGNRLIWRPASGRQPLRVVNGRARRRHRRHQRSLQYHPNDSWDWDEVSPPILVDSRRKRTHDHVGEVQAWHVDTGQKVWTHTYSKSPNWGGMLVTAGGVVFTGGTSDRRFHAFDATSGKLLWEFPTNSGILAPPSSFAIDGKQYVAVESGWGGDSRGMQATLNRLFPGDYPEVPEGGAIWVFALE